MPPNHAHDSYLTLAIVASISCVVNAGAIPVFADVDADGGNISPATIAEVITPRTRAVICAHLVGWPCEMHGIMAREVPCVTGSCSEMYLEKAFDGTDWRPEPRLPNARALGGNALAFLIHATLTAAEIDLTCAAIDAAMTEASA